MMKLEQLEAYLNSIKKVQSDLALIHVALESTIDLEICWADGSCDNSYDYLQLDCNSLLRCCLQSEANRLESWIKSAASKIESIQL